MPRKRTRMPTRAKTAKAHAKAADKTEEKEANVPRKTSKRKAPPPSGPKGYFESKKVSAKVKNQAEPTLQLQLINDQRVRTILSQLPMRHTTERANLLHSYESKYAEWNTQLWCGYNLLMYGVGSKKGLLEGFAASTPEDDGPVVIVNGYFARLSLKEVVFKVVAALGVGSEEELGCLTIASLLRRAKKAGKDPDAGRCYLLINNIDGPSLRNSEAQSVLAELAESGAVRMMATIDHVNAPLLWDKKLLARFNWLWNMTPTFEPYEKETENLPPLIAGVTKERQFRGSASVLNSLTQTCRDVFRILAELTQEAGEGITFSKLYNKCREDFCVSTEMMLRGHLTEFTDHELMHTKKVASAGGDLMSIPMSAENITKLLAEMPSRN
eukprot:CAMPEP_0198200754 /NCGR_PEP_ID=MMETSP1445-20131203/3709_1 /TAXON_ID=36898 /ORGANISM="Pyramimonas sp., Strain CCMP2087" /LENGTH=383 /DNA_ID=CAMNT_0043870899 /DNA_START=300 /DNA_END=1451 /DNA_ORIENTATION=+